MSDHRRRTVRRRHRAQVVDQHPVVVISRVPGGGDHHGRSVEQEHPAALDDVRGQRIVGELRRKRREAGRYVCLGHLDASHAEVRT